MKSFWKKVKKNLPAEFNQSWLCDEIGVATGTMSSWITHDRIPKADVAVRIAKALGVSVEYLVAEDDEEMIFEQEALKRDLSRVVQRRGVIVTPRNQEIMLHDDDDVVMLPVLEQKVSAGYGAVMIDSQETGDRVPVLRRLVARYDLSTLKAVEVRGDSMTGVNIFDGDIVVFAAGYISGEGIYVLSVHGDVLVKRIQFDSFEQTVRISSENPRYPDVKIVSEDSDNMKIHGKVVAWFHCHPY